MPVVVRARQDSSYSKNIIVKYRKSTLIQRSRWDQNIIRVPLMGDIFIQRLLEDDIMFDEKGDNKLN